MCLEKIDASPTQGDRYLDAVILQNQLIWRRQEVLDDSDPADRFIRVYDFLPHKSFCLYANRKCQAMLALILIIFDRVPLK